jgi:hypothetical protein
MNLLFSLLFSLLWSEPSNAINAVSMHGFALAKIDTVKSVAVVKSQFLAIDVKRKSLSIYSPTTKVEGTAFFGYFEGTKLRLINANFYTDTSKVEADEYVNDAGAVIVIYAKNSVYESPLSVNPRTKIKSMTENWYYFNNETLIKWVSGGKVVPSGTAEFKKMMASFKAEFPKHKKQFEDMNTLQKIK